MPKLAYQKQMRITGALRSGVRVFSATDVPVSLKTDSRSGEYLAHRARAVKQFHDKHPGARVIEVRLMTFKESDQAW